MIYRSLGRDNDCKAAARKVLEIAERDLVLHPEDSRPAIMGANALLRLGEKERAKDWAARAQAIEDEDPVSVYNVACIYSLLGEPEPAFDLLERAITNRRPFWKDWIANDSDLDVIRNHPRYAQLTALLEQQSPAT
jgi:adenylate cyclase